MIIDIHTHTFPDNIAERAITKLAAAANIQNRVSGTFSSLSESSRQNGVELSVLLPVATKSAQSEGINRNAVNINANSCKTHILSFGAIHPDNANYKELINFLEANNIKGIKLHPVYQDTAVDDIKNLRIIEYANEHGLAVTIHAGYDIGFPGNELSDVKRIRRMIDLVKPTKLILAHMGGWMQWDDVENYIIGLPGIYLDTAFTIDEVILPDGKTAKNPSGLSKERLVKIARTHGVSRILFGTDSPWGSQNASIDNICKCAFTEQEKSLILGENARLLLDL